MNKRFLISEHKVQIILSILMVVFLGSLNSCYSVFSGGTGGTVLDAESTSNPKNGIANVDVYAYMSSGERNKDFNSWTKGDQTKAFKPTAEYYGHTTTSGDGSFSLSKLVWKKNPIKSGFGKDADYTTVYLVYYHPDYGCTKGDTIIISDSTSDYTNVELKSIVKRTALTLNFVDVATGNQTNQTVYVEVKVPQKTDTNPNAEDKTYTATITGSGTIVIRYPRYIDENGTATYKETDKENTPEITVNYYQTREAEVVEWKACEFDLANQDYSFKDTVGADCEGVTKEIKNSPYTITLYGKHRIHDMPNISGQYVNAGDEKDDGVLISLKKKDSSGNYTIDCGEVTTTAENVGTNGTQKHGTFGNLGNNFLWIDGTYAGKYATADFGIFVGGTLKKEFTLRSDQNSYFVQL